jgi:hypothetical protein
LFRDQRINQKNAQLVFTTHDTTLLGQLNRDEVWLTEKERDGSTTLTALAEFGGDRVRKSLNLERAYLQGRFGALPRIRDSSLMSIMSPEPVTHAGSEHLLDDNRGEQREPAESEIARPVEESEGSDS